MGHINGLDADAYNSTGQQILFLSDSRVVTGAMAEGRSSSPLLSLRYRRVATVAHDIGAYLVYVPTNINPADEPSRTRHPRP